jgi:hypothetical protein
MIPPDSSRAFAILVGDKIVGFSPTDTAPIPAGGRILPVVDGEQPTTRANERLQGPNYHVTAEMVIAYYWVEAV